MGQRGPKPKPAHLKLLAGNPGGRPIQVGPVCDLPRAAPLKPDTLTAEAAAEWDRIVPELEAVGMLTTVDRAALILYCESWAEYQAAGRVLQAENRILAVPIQSSRGEVVGERQELHPAVKLQREAFDRVVRLLKEFGLTPAARDRAGFVGAQPGVAEKSTSRLKELAERFRTGS